MASIDWSIVFMFVIAIVFSVTVWTVLAWNVADWAAKRGADRLNMFLLSALVSPVWVFIYVRWIR